LQEIETQIDNLVSEVVEILNKYSASNISVTYENVFSKYGMDYTQNQWFMYPYGKFKINFRCERLESC
jgi:hypothetical protein